MKTEKMQFLVVISLIIFLAVLPAAFAKTECKTDGCKITITINIAFANATNAQINSWANEIGGVWNGPNGQTTGDCKCPVYFNVSTKSVANCTPIPAGYHCVNVLKWNNSVESLPQLPAGPRAGERVTGYMGKTTQSPSVNSLDGDWSDQMSRPINASDPSQGNYKDAAHEAGHMMGLGDGVGGIMNFTSGPNSTPTQDNIDQAVSNVCGSNACPDRCCCGNGVVDAGKEACDPLASPTGCNSGESCCAVCCNCYKPTCDAQKGEYTSLEGCQKSCTSGSSCYQNYKTGCWDCLKQMIVEEPYAPESVNKIIEHLHPTLPAISLETIKEFFDSGINANPTVAGMFANEKINVYVDGFGTVGIETKNSEIVSTNEGGFPDQTVNIKTSVQTIQEIYYGEKTALTAIKAGEISYEGIGLFKSIELGAANFFMGIYLLFSDI